MTTSSSPTKKRSNGSSTSKSTAFQPRRELRRPTGLSGRFDRDGARRRRIRRRRTRNPKPSCPIPKRLAACEEAGVEARRQDRGHAWPGGLRTKATCCWQTVEAATSQPIGATWKAAYAAGASVVGKVTETVKGGLAVDVGARAFPTRLALRRAGPGRRSKPWWAKRFTPRSCNSTSPIATWCSTAACHPRRGTAASSGSKPSQGLSEGRRSSRASSAASATSAPSSTWAASTRCSTSRTSPGDASRKSLPSSRKATRVDVKILRVDRGR